MWYVCFALSATALVFSLYKSFIDMKKGKSFSINKLIAGVFLSVVLIFAPIYADYFASDGVFVRVFKTALISLHHAIRLFIVDSDFDIIKEYMGESSFYTVYACYVAVLYVCAPLLTFGFVLSFFKNISAYWKYIIRYKKDMFVFSEVNKKSIALGKSILEKYPDSAVVYTGKTIYAEDEECGGIFGNRKIIYFSKDMLSVKFGFHSKKKEIRFFVIGEDEAKNVKQSLNVIELFKDRANTWAYVFSNKIEGEIILSSVDKNLLKLRRISDERTLIHSILQEKGEQLFKEALTIEGSKDKLISALVIGLSGCGAEMTKTLAWFGQMCNYKLEITAIDALCDAKDRIAAISPDLLKEEYNGNFTDDGEAQYKIDIKEGLTPGTASFYEEIEKIGKITYIFIDTGDDEENIGTAIQIRSRLTKNNMSPRIQAVVHDSERIKALKDVKNYSGQSYDIDFVGDVDSFYTVDNIMNSELEAEALARHMKWGSEDVFWNFEYNRRSSIASALHRRMKIACGVPGANKAVADRSEEEKINLRKLEHRRWNAYMRSEGYTYAEKRNNLAKTHNCLVTFDKLTREEQEKDDD